MTDVTKIKQALQADIEISENATDAPWRTHDDWLMWEKKAEPQSLVQIGSMSQSCLTQSENEDNAKFIVHARNFLESRVRALEVALRLIEEVDRITRTPEFIGVFQIAKIHGCEYVGEQFYIEKALSEIARLLGVGE